MPSKIEWLWKPGYQGETLNPIRARHNVTGAIGWHCEKVGPGCAHCYSETMNLAGRFRGTKLPFVRSSGGGVWVFMDKHVLRRPLHWRKPRMIFWCDMTDLFGRWASDSWIEQCFAVMALTPQHIHCVLTKRPERMARYFSHVKTAMRGWWHGEIGYLVNQLYDGEELPHQLLGTWCAMRKHYYPDASPNKLGDTSLAAPWPLPNVWLGTSCENQKTAEERIPHLLKCPASVRFVSAEPLLEHLDIRRWLPLPSLTCAFCGSTVTPVGWMRENGRMVVECDKCLHKTELQRTRDEHCNELDWIITGGESGPKARPCDVWSIRSLLRQCREAGTPCFVKQLGSNVRDNATTDATHYEEDKCWPDGTKTDYHRVLLRDSKGGDMAEWPEDLRVREWPDVANGCE